MPKKEKDPTEGNYTTIKLPNDLVIEMDQLIGKHGFKSRSEIIKDALRELLTRYKNSDLPRFEHFNIDPDGARITRAVGLENVRQVVFDAIQHATRAK